MARKTDPAYITERGVFQTRLRELMKQQGTTQKELAKVVEMRPQTVSLYVTGQSVPDINTLKRISIFFNVSADYLLGLSDVATPATDLKGVCDYTGLSEGAVESIRYLGNKNDYPGHILQILSLFIETNEFVKILLNLERIRDCYCMDPSSEPFGIDDVFNAEDTAKKVGFVILDHFEAAEHYAQKASLALHEFSTKTLRQFAEAEKEADNGEHTEN